MPVATESASRQTGMASKKEEAALRASERMQASREDATGKLTTSAV
jgi:hypothetical protein